MLKVGQDVTVKGTVTYVGEDHVVVHTSDNHWFQVKDFDAIVTDGPTDEGDPKAEK